MSDVQDTNAKRSRTARSTREYIDSDGNVVDRMENAQGMRFTLVGGTKSWDYIHGQFPFADKCMALFGAPTKFGNVANTVFNPPDKSLAGDVHEAELELDSFWSDLTESEIWVEREGGTGRRIDRGMMARAAINIAVNAGKLKDDPETRGEAEQRQLEKFESDKKYWGRVRQNHEILREYTQLMGGTMRSAVDVLEL